MVFLASVGSVGALRRPVRHRLGHHAVSFSAIAVSKQHEPVSVVAPGIAEALFATAIGLVAAIPAVLAYNKLSTDLARLAASRIEGFGSGVRRHPVAPKRGAGVDDGSRHRRLRHVDRKSGPATARMAEINVTPMVDVMLVLLIVFMVAAPLMTSGVNVDLPKASAAPLSQDSEPVTVSVNAEGKVFVGDAEAALPDLVGRLQSATDSKPDRRIYVRGDKGISYGRIMEVMATITQGGFTKVALLAEQTGTPGAPVAPASSAPSGAGAAAVPSVPAAPAPAASAPPTAGVRRQGRG